MVGNRSLTKLAQLEPWNCPKCNSEFYIDPEESDPEYCPYCGYNPHAKQ